MNIYNITAGNGLHVTGAKSTAQANRLAGSCVRLSFPCHACFCEHLRALCEISKICEHLLPGLSLLALEMLKLNLKLCSRVSRFCTGTISEPAS